MLKTHTQRMLSQNIYHEKQILNIKYVHKVIIPLSKHTICNFQVSLQFSLNHLTLSVNMKNIHIQDHSNIFVQHFWVIT